MGDIARGYLLSEFRLHKILNSALNPENIPAMRSGHAPVHWFTVYWSAWSDVSNPEFWNIAEILSFANPFPGIIIAQKNNSAEVYYVPGRYAKIPDRH